MPIELKVPVAGESITEVEVGAWLKAKGDFVEKDEPVVVLETEKASVELPAPVSGTITEIRKNKGDTAAIGEVLAYLESGPPAPPRPAAAQAAPISAPETRPAPPEAPPRVMPAAEQALAEHGLRAQDVKPSGPGGRLLKEDVLRHIEEQRQPAPPPPPAIAPPQAEKEITAPAPTAPAAPPPTVAVPDREEEVVPMSRLRRTVAQRLLEAQRNTAMLTTFNEIDMAPVMAFRKERGEAFQQKYSIKLGLMSFFVKASIDALKLFPAVNAEIRGNDIVYHNYYDIGLAVSTDRGLVVPVLRDAERMSFAEVELATADFARRARESKLKLEELQGGTFTITNGGVFGSLLSTPILNPPQSGILGMHAIQDRPVARAGAVVIRPMMYVALTYDHRLIDGREAVSFLRRIKELIEEPVRMLIEV